MYQDNPFLTRQAENLCFYSYVYACLLFSRTLSTFLTVRMYQHMKDLMFLHVSFFMSVYLFHGLVPCLPFFTARIFRSATPSAKIGVLFHAWNISDFYARGRNVRFFSHAFCTHA